MKKLVIAPLLLICLDLTAQPNFPDLSPQGSIRQKVGFTTISVINERPSARGRKIFGELVPYGKLWRTGAGNCTKIKFNEPVFINSRLIQPGTYSLFTIPDEKEWTVILNNDTTLYGTGGYDERKDVLRFQIKSEPASRYYESFTIDIDVISDNAELNFSWENTKTSFRIETETERKIGQMVNDELLSGKIKDPQKLAIGAEYYYFLGRDLEIGLALIDRALDMKARSWFYSVKIDILTKSKRYAEAIETLKLSMIHVRSNPENWTKEQLDNVVKGQALQMKELLSKVDQQ